MGYFDNDEMLTPDQEKMRDSLTGKSGARYLTNDTVVYAEKHINPTVDSGKIALKCADCIFCIRGHMEYANYRISDRSNCPQTCELNK